MAKTPLLGLTIPNPDGSDDAGQWPGISGQGLIDLENTLDLATDSKSSSDLTNAWPKGMSVMGVTPTGASSGNWPVSTGGLVLTARRPSDATIYQLFFSGSNVGLSVPVSIQVRLGTGAGWSSWRQIISPGTPTAVATGQVTGTAPAAGGTVAMNVTFPAGRFTAAPKVTVSVQSSLPSQVSCGYGGVSATGCTIYMYRQNDTTTTISWVAVQGVDV